MFSDWTRQILTGIITLNDILTAGIAITAFSLFLYALSFNLRHRVARSFAIILLCVVIVFTAEALAGSATTREATELLLRLEWFGILFLPPAYFHFSDALLVTSGLPSRPQQRWLVRLLYLVSAGFLLLLASGYLLGPLSQGDAPAPYLQRTLWTEIFTVYYIAILILAWRNFIRAYRNTLTRFGRRRMLYLLTGAVAPALGSFPYLLYGSPFAAQHPYLFWGIAVVFNLVVGTLIVLMAYSVAFFGVSWPDRVVRSRLLKWLMRGPVTASVALAVMTIVRRIGEVFGVVYSGLVPASMVFTVLLMEHTITLVAPLWERLLFYGKDEEALVLLRNLEDRFITQNDLRQFFESLLAAVRDHLQAPAAFLAALESGELSLLVTAGALPPPREEDLNEALQVFQENEHDRREYLWGNYLIFPLFREAETLEGPPTLLGILGVVQKEKKALSPEQRQALDLLLQRGAMALYDRLLQQRVFRSLEDLRPQVDMFQRLRALGRYDSRTSLLQDVLPPESDLASWVKDALTHYWGGPKLTQSPLLQLQIVQQAMREHGESPANALRSVLRMALDSVRPEGERRFTPEWILFNILEMKFIEGRKVREVANRLAMSEADLYRKQRVAIEQIARVLLDMEREYQKKSLEKEQR